MTTLTALTYTELTSAQVHELYRFEVLDATNKQHIEEAAVVLTDTFLGVQVGKAYIEEPMMKEAHISKDAFKKYLIEVLNDVATQGLTTIALDRATGKVVGAVVSENYTPGTETVLLEGELSAMNIVNLTTDRLIAEYFTDLHEREVKLGSNDFVHLFLVGINTEYNKRYIAKELGLLSEKVAQDKGVKTIFCYSSNFRSQNMFKKILNYELAHTKYGKPISLDYATDEYFNKIPKDIAVDGQILVKNLV